MSSMEEKLPENPVESWDEDTLRSKWVQSWTAYQQHEQNGMLRLLAVRQIHDELVERGIEPKKVLQHHGVEV